MAGLSVSRVGEGGNNRVYALSFHNEEPRPGIGGAGIQTRVGTSHTLALCGPRRAALPHFCQPRGPCAKGPSTALAQGRTNGGGGAGGPG